MTTMHRKRLTDLMQWLDSKYRMPLIMRGARQVGKTWLVRQLANKSGRRLIEINLEKNPEYASLFFSNDVKKIINYIESVFDVPIKEEDCILFIDEVQAIPELIAKLRWFKEDMQALPVIAAGSLLEFVLAEHTFSMPVGRVQYMHIEPLSFEEFLMAIGHEKLANFLENFNWLTELPQIIHDKLMQLFAEYIIIGGMPTAVASWKEEHSLNRITQTHNDLLSTYRDDFAKYAGKLPIQHLNDVLTAVPKLLGKKFKYTQVNSQVQSAPIKKALDLLCKARICHKVQCTAANGIPLAAESKEREFKIILLDVGLVSAALGLRLNQIDHVNKIDLINQGGVAEQVVGQLLRIEEDYYIEPQLFYWIREEATSNAELDYLIQHTNQIIPIEVKSGKAGTLKSLHVFMAQKQGKIAVRINSHLPEKKNINMKTQTGEIAEYVLLSIPFYLSGQLYRLLSL